MRAATAGNTGLTRSVELVDSLHLMRTGAVTVVSCLDDVGSLLAGQDTGSRRHRLSLPYISPRLKTRQSRALGAGDVMLAGSF